MRDLWLKIRLLSDTTFGSGYGLAGVIHQEVEHDASTGLPQIKGRTLKGLLVEECANLLYSLKIANPGVYAEVEEMARTLFGSPGSDLNSQGLIHIGTGTLPRELVRRVLDKRLNAQMVLESLTTIRYQTAVDQVTNIPKENTLRASRAVIRETIFVAPVETQPALSTLEVGLLAVCARAVRRGGLSRTRGRGRLEVSLEGITGKPIEDFLKTLGGEQ